MPKRDQIDQVKRLERRLEELDALVKVIGKVNRSLEPDDVLKVSLEGFQGILGSDFGCFLLIQPDQRTLRIEQPTAVPPTLLAKLQLLALDPRVETATADDQPDLLQSLGQRLHGLLTEEGIDRYALIPLTARARPVGILLASIGIDSMLTPPSVDLLMSIRPVTPDIRVGGQGTKHHPCPALAIYVLDQGHDVEIQLLVGRWPSKVEMKTPLAAPPWPP